MSRNKRSNLRQPKSNKAKRVALVEAKHRKGQRTSVQERREAKYLLETAPQEKLAASRKLTRNVPEAIRQILKDQINNKDLQAVPQTHRLHQIHKMWWDYFKYQKALAPVAEQLLLALEEHKCDWLARRDNGQYRASNYVYALASLIKLHEKWEHSLEAWKPGTRNSAKQFASLLRHLLAKYYVPLFMDEAWFGSGEVRHTTRIRANHQDWWLHIAEGKNIRKADGLPFPLTKKMAHHFLQTPTEFGVKGALRWGQIHALGGNERTVKGVMNSPLRENFDNHEFWASVIRFFIDNPMLDTIHYGPIYDYLRNQKYIVQRGAEAPPQPNLSMHGRTAEALLKQVESWHRRLGGTRRSRKKPTVWEHGSIPDFELIQKRKRGGRIQTVIYQIIELLNTKELQTEGRRLQHCVGSYSWSCANGTRSIWSVRRYQSENNWEALGTVEMNPRTKTIVQFSAKKNSPPGPKAHDLVRQWCKKQGIRLSRWIAMP